MQFEKYMWIIEGAIAEPQAGFIIRVKFSNSIIGHRWIFHFPDYKVKSHY
jgi:hypothetical protein